MTWLSRFTSSAVLYSVLVVACLWIFFLLQPLREPPLIASLGEYTVGNYPTGIALYQPSSGHYYSTSIYDDFIVTDNQRQSLETLPNTYNSRRNRLKTLSYISAIANQWLKFPGVHYEFYSGERDLFIQTVVSPTSSSSAKLTRTWYMRKQQNISAGSITIKFAALDFIIDPTNKLLYADADRAIDQSLLEQKTKQTLTATGALTQTNSTWEVDSRSIILINPDGAGVLRFKAVGDQMIFINPAKLTIEFITGLPQSGEHEQQILIETWPTITEYPWSTP